LNSSLNETLASSLTETTALSLTETLASSLTEALTSTETLAASSIETPSTNKILLSTSEIITNIVSEDFKNYLDILIGQHNALQDANRKLFDELNQQRAKNEELNNEIKILRDEKKTI